MPLGAKLVLISTENTVVTPTFNSLKAVDPTVGTPSIWTAASSSPGISPDFAGLSYQKIGVSQWIKTTAGGITFEGGNGILQALSNTSDIHITTFWTTTGASNKDMIATPVVTQDGNWHHIYYYVDSTQAVESDRGKVYLDGIEVAAFSALNTPIQNDTLAFSLGSVWEDGRVLALSGSADDRWYQYAIFSGTLPTIGDLYNAGAPKDISTLPGLYSWLDFTDSIVLNDSILSFTWEEETPDQWTLDSDIPS